MQHGAACTSLRTPERRAAPAVLILFAGGEVVVVWGEDGGEVL